MTVTTALHARARRFRLLAMGLPTTIAVFSIIYSLIKLPLLPNQIATSFSGNNTIDDLSTPLPYIALVSAITLGIAIGLGALAKTVNRMLVGINVAMTTLFSTLLLIHVIRVNLANAADVTQVQFSGTAITIHIVAAILIGAVAALAARPVIPAAQQ